MLEEHIYINYKLIFPTFGIKDEISFMLKKRYLFLFFSKCHQFEREII